ncbi:hypothetical protein COU57_01080 [Candidatus Pacearchaeota archaeon CG10_big_fil_rev_8_21_14_0_10_32_14]|nr:MAG: hypothetical protein COU57_01080 [Candidatus Pacearchaeota archaeon CG10_big_fil_rev_8_21_14_0_10_32_14]
MEIKKILHYPRLDSVLMVEKFIYDNSGTYKKKQIWERLPKKMMYQTYSVIIDYLLYAGRIAVDSEGKIAWIWDPKLVRKYIKRTDLEWK